VVEAVSKAIRDVRLCGKPAGVLAVTSELVEAYKLAGATFVGVGSDCGVLAKGVQRLYKSFASGKQAKGDY
jgi:2-keto-3-deoxy-L-rhamnonate aldolase RhmA